MGGVVVNFIIIAVILCVVILSIFFVFQSDSEKDKRFGSDGYTIEQLAQKVKEVINENMNVDIAALGLSQAETKKREEQRKLLKNAVRTCMYGGRGEKEYLIDYIRNLLQKRFGIDEVSINFGIPFHMPDRCSSRDLFDILLYLYSKENYKTGFLNLAKAHGWLEPDVREDGLHYVVTEEMLRKAYEKEGPVLSYVDKLEILSYRIYSYFGHGVIDMLRDNAIDGIDGAQSGLSEDAYDYRDVLQVEEEERRARRYAYDSIWVQIQGIWLHLDCLSFESSQELERVTRALIKYDAPYELTRNRPRIFTDMKDGSRVMATRPPLSETWTFFLRKFESAPRSLALAYTDENSENMIKYLKFLVKGSVHMAITGPMGAGKTWLVKELIREINPTYNIRTAETMFELNVRKILPERNIVPFRETDSVSMEELMESLRKSDASAILLGEVASERLASLSTQLAKITEQQILTTHQTSTRALIAYFKQALMNQGSFANERLAEEEAVRSMHIDVRVEKDTDTGHRYIKYINEIVPVEDDNVYGADMDENRKLYYERQTQRHVYDVRTLVRFDDGKYIIENKPSEALLERMFQKMRKDDRDAFLGFMYENNLDKAS